MVYFANRAAIEYEKKMKDQNIKQSQIMENHFACMAREIEKLQEELANAEKQAREAASVTPGNLDLRSSSYV